MGLLNRLKAVALIGCIFFSCQTFADDYYWDNGDGVHHSDPSDACSKDMGTDNGRPITFDKVNFNSDTGGRCQYLFDSPPRVWPGSTQVVNRRGTSCPAGTGPYNSATGMCATAQFGAGDQCEGGTGGTSVSTKIWDATTNSCVPFPQAQGDAPCQFLKRVGESNPNHVDTAYTVAGSVVAGVAVAPPTFAQDGLTCTMATVSSSNCKIGISGTATCNVTGKFTGQASATGQLDVSDALCPNGTCAPQVPEVKTQDQPCVPVGTGNGGTGCTSVKETVSDGSQTCGTVNGSFTCVTKHPGSNGLTTVTNATSQTLPDGSVKVTVVKDSSNTVCTDIATCTTKTSSTTSHSTTSPSGGTKTDSSCTGSCSSNGGGVETNPNAGTGNGTGAGTGTGNGSCTGNDCGEGGNGTASTTQDCAAPPPCDGDPFQCAILQQAHLDTCKLMAAPTATEQAGMDAKVAKSQQDLADAQTAMDSQVNTLLGGFQAATSGSGAGGGKCLPDVPFSVMGHSMDMEFSKTCDSISFIRLAIIAMAYLFAARVVFTEV